MKSNIVFTSNLYTINKSIDSDIEFLSKIYDFNKLKKLDKRYFSVSGHSVWNREQIKIIRELPVCGLNPYKDPCWGMTKQDDRIIWKCKCLHTECKYFSECRTDYNEEEQTKFSPIYFDAEKTYEYLYKGRDITIYPIETYEQFKYHPDDAITHPAEEKVDNVDEEKISEINIIEVLQKENELQVKGNTYSEKEVNEPVAEDKTKLNDICQNTSENIFSHFVECEQEKIICSDPNNILFVDAGPGTGKTYTLIKKLEYMVCEQGLSPDGILVLCFTNAAVDEIKDRLRNFVTNGADRGLINVDVRTFHSFAWWLIGQANAMEWENINMSSLNFDMSLKKAAAIISKHNKDILYNWEHFIVDEVQDLTNTLARFVLYIVSACVKNQCGFTVLGDACQSIYNYMENESLESMRSEEFYNALFNQIHDKAEFLKLTKNHRQNQELISQTTPLREAILSQEHAEMESATSKLMNEVCALDKTSISIQFEDLEDYRNGGKVCLLLRNNGQTLRVSSNLRKKGIPHILNCTETDFNYASWVSDVFNNYTSKYITYEEFEQRISKNLITKQHSPKDIWQRLCQLLHDDDDELKVKDILDGIMYSKIDDSILRIQRNGNIIVSNIHRAKGREYESVIIDSEFAESMINEKADPDEYKTLYVGVTRPKKRLYAAPLQKRGELSFLQIFDTQRNRWGKVKKQQNTRQITYMEFNSSLDLNINSFSSVPQTNFDNVAIDDEVTLIRKIVDGEIEYSIMHESTGIILGKIDRAYIDDMMHYMQIVGNPYEMPDRISDLYVSGIYSQIVDEEYLKLHPNITTRAWKWIEIVGVGHAQYGLY